ncbi:MAG: hypothetical protein JEY99_17830 [Spirochaetales bacterium]|nr:hypothetical protein [Spirochaetales bacterium]
MDNVRLPEKWERILGSDSENSKFNLSDFYLKIEGLVAENESSIIPRPDLIYNVFRKVEPQNVKVVLYGEDPYPRRTSANGVAFWDEEVVCWESKTSGNSLRNIIKALLIHKGWASYETPVTECRGIIRDKKVASPPEFFENWLSQGILLLNTSLTLSVDENRKMKKHFSQWREFQFEVLKGLHSCGQKPWFILWGNKAQALKPMITDVFGSEYEKIIEGEHPTFQYQFLRKSGGDKHYSPFTEIIDKTGLSWL